MGHNILENMFAGKESAWHNLGVVDGSLNSAVAAVYVAGMNYDIYKAPLTVHTPDGQIIPFDSFAIMRGPTVNDDNHVPLGTCSADYEFFQNYEIAGRIDQLASETGWKFSTAGVLGKGETIFICLDMGQTQIGGEDVSRYFTYVETRNGKTVARAFNSRVRVVCRNTLDLGIKRASSKIALRHYSEYKLDADWVMNMVTEAERTGQNIDEALNILSQIQISEHEYQDMLDRVVEMPSMPNLLNTLPSNERVAEKKKRTEYLYSIKLELANRTKDAINSIYQSAHDIPAHLRGTAWHAYQAVTHYTTHIHGTLGSRGKKMDYRNRAEWDIFEGGVDMRNRAYNALTEMY